ncbi:hypothetical protein CTV96_09520 [Bacillus altitudinis]|uniref:hypothetical protein n=1 Tax=Bacillus altitudinis TaxID=293387 RepID=UPI000C24DF1C|nr:hypothetical protein [Bacillus altitudinis]PJI12376.1 hypothetical protein CTV96_09520 [Bacillus altitudinis]PKQ85610.1 hypothetical protein CTV98_007575 [Bacillus altitudinis]
MAALKGVKTIDMVGGEITKVSYEGSEYERVEGDAKVGDLILPVKGWLDISVGGFYIIDDIERDGDAYFYDDVGELNALSRVNYVPFRKKHTRLKVGDYAKVINNVMEYREGDIVQIAESDSSFDFKVDFINVTGSSKITGQVYGYIDAKDLTRATDAEVAEAKAKLAPKFSVGDYAKVVGDTYHSDIDGGAIVKITDLADSAGDLRFELVGGDDDDYDFAKPSSLEKVSAEEVKWAKIGRKVDEYKVGDIVQFKDDYVAIGVVEDVGVRLLSVRMPDEAYQSPYKNNVMLITPVEARFDRS